MNNFSGLRTNEIEAIVKTGQSLCKSPSASPNKKLKIAKYCDLCNRIKDDLDGNRSKSRINCNFCSKVICSKHTFSYCPEHKLN